LRTRVEDPARRQPAAAGDSQDELLASGRVLDLVQGLSETARPPGQFDQPPVDAAELGYRPPSVGIADEVEILERRAPTEGRFPVQRARRDQTVVAGPLHVLFPPGQVHDGPVLAREKDVPVGVETLGREPKEA
jgi:hypothetical protein